MYTSILVPIDGSPTSSHALGEAAKLAKLCGARLRLLHIIDPLRHITGFEPAEIYTRDIAPAMMKAGEEILSEARSRLAALGVNAETELHESRGERIAEAIIADAQSWGADLIVLGTHGRRGIGRVLIGSDAEQVVRISPVPVLLVRLQEAAGKA